MGDEWMANAPWAMKQEWHHVVFLHWPVSAESLRDKIPEELEIDEFNGTAWIGLVLFKAEKTRVRFTPPIPTVERSEEHTSELQSRENLVCRLLLEKKKKNEHRRTDVAS